MSENATEKMRKGEEVRGVVIPSPPVSEPGPRSWSSSSPGWRGSCAGCWRSQVRLRSQALGSAAFLLMVKPSDRLQQIT